MKVVVWWRECGEEKGKKKREKKKRKSLTLRGKSLCRFHGHPLCPLHLANTIKKEEKRSLPARRRLHNTSEEREGKRKKKRGRKTRNASPHVRENTYE